jgi:hypothetical protein
MHVARPDSKAVQIVQDLVNFMGGPFAPSGRIAWPQKFDAVKRRFGCMPPAPP